MSIFTRAAIAVSVSGLIVVGAALPVFGDEPLDPAKAWVCKYVGKPGVDERLQTGSNPILVDRKVGDVIGSPFADAQGRSVIIAWGSAGDNAANSPNQKTVADCAITTPTPTTVTTTTPSTTTTSSTTSTTTTTKATTPQTTTTKTTTTKTTTTKATTTKATPRGVAGKTGVEDEVPVLPFAGLGALAVAGASFVALKRRQL